MLAQRDMNTTLKMQRDKYADELKFLRTQWTTVEKELQTKIKDLIAQADSLKARGGQLEKDLTRALDDNRRLMQSNATALRVNLSKETNDLVIGDARVRGVGQNVTYLSTLYRELVTLDAHPPVQTVKYNVNVIPPHRDVDVDTRVNESVLQELQQTKESLKMLSDQFLAYRV